MSTDCIFCKIIAGEIPSEMLYTDELVVAFRDLNPIAPTHILIIPKKHIPTNNDVLGEDEPVLGRLFSVARKLAESEGIAEEGYRLTVNTNKDGGQVVFHMHLHLMGGRRMKSMG